METLRNQKRKVYRNLHAGELRRAAEATERMGKHDARTIQQQIDLLLNRPGLSKKELAKLDHLKAQHGGAVTLGSLKE